MPDDSPDQAGRKPEARSRITNGRDLLPDIDQRSTWARRLRDLLDVHADDLGGVDRTSEAQRSLIRRASVLEVEAEYLETKMAQRIATAADMDLYLRLTGVLKRLFDTIGVERRARDVTPSVGEWLEQQKRIREGEQP